jgi:beta-mannanase
VVAARRSAQVVAEALGDGPGLAGLVGLAGAGVAGLAGLACRPRRVPSRPPVPSPHAAGRDRATARHRDGHARRTGGTEIFVACPAENAAGQLGGEHIVRSTLRKSVFGLAALLAGAGATLIGTAPAHAGPAPKGAGCVTGARLVPSCGVLWGAAAGGFTSAPRDEELKSWEKLSGRTATIFHAYHKGDEPFPTADEIAMTRDPAHPRVLLLNWRVEYGSTWAKVAAGKLDARIDALATRLKSSFTDKFFLVLNHEPEDDVRPAAGSGMTAKDFAASYRHVIRRLRAEGVGNAVSVVAYMGNERWMAQSWWSDLYPGDDVVDWVGLDSYVSAESGYYHNGMFADLLDRRAPGGAGFYDWAVRNHPAKPVMVAEWGVYHRVGKVVSKAAAFNSVLPQLAKRRAIKAIVYFDTDHDAFGDRDISIDSSGASLGAFRRLAASPLFDVRLK